MNKNFVIVAVLLIFALLVLDLVLRPSLRQKDAVKVVDTVLTHWVNGDLPLAMAYWVKEIDTPPVFGLVDYEIDVGTFGKSAGRHTAQIPATLDFTPNNPLPSGKIWIFEMERARYGWKITDFHLAEGSLPN